MSTTTLINNATTVAKIYEAFGRGDISYILSQIADNCKWVAAGEGSLTQGGTYTGKDVVNFFNRMLEKEEFNAFNPVSINNINDNEVAAFGSMVVTSKVTGRKVSSEWAMHWKFNDESKVVYFQNFFDTAAVYIAHQL